MIDGFLCDDCESMFDFDNLGVIGSPDDDCNPYMDLMSLCDNCIFPRLDKLLATMKVDPEKFRDFEWLNDNFFSRPSENVFFIEAKFLVKAIIQNKPKCQKD